MTSYVLGLHSKLVKSGVDPQSDEYYETIDSRMRTVFSENLRTLKRQKSRGDNQMWLHPPTRSTSPKKVRLTQTQVTLAKRLGVPLELYAKKVAEEMRKK
jgi:hypothetical protein